MTVSSDNFTWGSLVAGSWDLPSNWIDTTTGANPALVAPGANDAVTIGAAGGGATHVITGVGNSTSLTVSGATVLAGTFNTGSLNAADSLTLNAGGSLGVTGDASIGYSGGLTVNGGTVTVGGKLTSTNTAYNSGLTVKAGALNVGRLSAEGNVNISGGTVTVQGDVTAQDYMMSPNYYLTGGTLTVGGTFYSFNNLSLSNGAQAQFGALSYSTFVTTMMPGQSQTTLDGITLYLYGTSSLEIGAAGGAATGALTIDAGATVNEFGSLTAPTFVVKGELDVTAGRTLTISGSAGIGMSAQSGGLTGGGQVKIGAGSSLIVNALPSTTADVTVSFAGAQGALTLAATDLGAGNVFAPTISGFDSTDVIDWQGTLTGASFDSGTLTLVNGATAVAKLTLTGNYAGQTFAVAQLGNGNTQINVLGAGDTATAPAGTASADAYAWGSLVAGSWDLPSNWIDTTTGANPALVAPGANDAVTIGAAGGGATHVITGVGNSTSLTVSGATVLAGTFNTGSLNAADSLTLNAGGSLGVTGDASIGYSGGLTVNGGTVTVGGKLTSTNTAYNSGLTVKAGALNVGRLSAEGNVNISGGTVTVQGDVTAQDYMMSPNYYLTGGTLTVGGTFYSFNNLSLSNGAQAQFGALSYSTFVTTMMPGQSQTTLDGITLYLYGTSSLEIGAAGGAATGALTIDAGATVNEFGSLTAPTFVVKGELDVTAGRTLTISGSAGIGMSAQSGGLTGGGQVKIGAGSSLIVNALPSTTADVTVSFAGAQGALTLAATDLGAGNVFAPTISGFDSTDVIDWQGTLTGASFDSGTLTLVNGATAVAKLTLTGNYAGQTFAVAQLGNGNTQINVLGAGDTATAPAGTASADAYAWGSLVAGSWDLPSNWIDTTTGANPALVAPGANDAVTIGAAGGGATHVITGVGNSTSLTVSGATVLAGTFNTGSLNAADSLTLNAGGSLGVTGDASIGYSGGLTVNGGTVTVGGKLTSTNTAYNSGLTVKAGALNVGRLSAEGNVNISGGTVTVQGDVTAQDYMMSPNYYLTGGTLTVGGTFYSFNNLSLSNGAQAQFGALSYSTFVTTMMPGQSQTTLDGITLYLYGTSSLEIGAAGGAATGALTIDAGAAVNEFGSLTAPTFVVKGELDVTAGRTLTISGSAGIGMSAQSGGLTGGGQVKIGAGSSLIVNALPSTTADVTVSFAGAQGALTLAATDLGAGNVFAPTISGFDSTDVIDWQGTLTGASFDSGTLTLVNGATAVAKLTLTGNYAGHVFTTAQLANNTVQIQLVPGAGSPTIYVTADYFSANIDALAADASVTTVFLTDTGTPTLSLNVAQALGDGAALAKISGSYQIAIHDTAAHISAQFSQLASDAQVASIAVTDGGTLAFSLAQAQTYATTLAKLSGAFKLEISDSSVSIAGLTVSQAVALRAQGFAILATQGPTTLTLDLASALSSDGFTLTGGPVTVAMTASALHGLTIAGIGALATLGVNEVKATDAVPVLSLAQKRALGAAGVTLEQPYSGGSTDIVKFNPDGSTHEVTFLGIVGQPYTSIDAIHGANGAVTSLTWYNGTNVYAIETINADGSHDFHNFNPGSYKGVAYVSSDNAYTASGFLYQQTFYDSAGHTLVQIAWQPNGSYAMTRGGSPWIEKQINADGSYELAQQQIVGAAFTAYEYVYDNAKRLAAHGQVNVDGSGLLTLDANGLTVKSGAGRLDVQLGASAGGDVFAFQMNTPETVFAIGRSNETLSFDSGFGQEKFVGFVVAGSGADTLAFNHAAFSYLDPAANTATDLAALVSNHAFAQIGADTTITDSAHDILTLRGVNAATLIAHGTFAFT